MPTYNVNHVAYPANNAYFVTVASTERFDLITLWHPTTGKPLHSFKSVAGGVSAISCSPDGQYILAVIAGVFNGNLLLWKIENFCRVNYKRIRLWDGDETNGFICVGFSPNSQYAFVGIDDSLTIWKIPDWEEIRTFHDLYPVAAAFTHDSQHILTSSPLQLRALSDGSIVKQRQRQTDILPGETGEIMRIVLSPDDKICYFWGEFSIFALDIEANETKFITFIIDRSQSALNPFIPGGISSDGKLLVSAFDGARLCTIDTTNGNIVREYIGHEDLIADVIFSPDDQYILSASWDGTARLWDIETGKEILRLEPFADQK